jgi:methylated-DNA-[protein]-cysteine S-methyltransferase
VKPAGTNFQRSVWKKLQDIPYGKTVTYGELAENLGDANKVRAVGKANGSNPIPIIIPCHRVIGADNKLVGYAGGISRKRYLLRHEGAILL